MKTALLSTSLAVALLAIAASYVLPSGWTTDQHRQPYKFASAR